MLPRTDSERPVRENPEGRKGGSVPRVEDPTVCHLRRWFRKGQPSRCPRQRGHLLRFHTRLSWPSGDTGFRVAIELRTILQPTSLRARWTPRRDDFRVVRDDRRLVTMGAVSRTGEDKLHFGRIGARALWTQYSRRRAEGPSIDDEVLRRTCLDCAVDGTISGNDGGNGDTEGRTWKADRMGEGLPSCESKGGKPGNFKAACP